MADTERGDFTGEKCDDCHKREVVVKHWGSRVPPGTVGKFCGICMQARIDDQEAGLEPRPIGTCKNKAAPRELRLQQYKLDAKEIENEPFSMDHHPCGRWENLKKDLQKKGGIILAGQQATRGIPADILVGNIFKKDFCELLKKHNLPFSSGDIFFEE